MTILAVAELIERSLSGVTPDVQVGRKGDSATLTAAVGEQTFVILVQELAKDRQEPANT